MPAKTVRAHDVYACVNSYRELSLDLTTWNSADLIRGDGCGRVLLSERAQGFFGAIGAYLSSSMEFIPDQNPYLSEPNWDLSELIVIDGGRF